MAELIDRYATMDAIPAPTDADEAEYYGKICDAIEAMPTIEPEPVRNGRWKTKVIHDAYCFQCSACNSIYNGDTHYCPHCGAKMDAGHIADDSKKVGGADNG